MMKDQIIAFPWYGGKNNKLKWLLPLLPYDKTYAELFGGSAGALLNRKKSPREVYNDLDDNVVCFFQTLRDSKEELLEMLNATPHSRQEYVNCANNLARDDISVIERARCFFVVSVQGFVNTSDGDPSLGSWTTKYPNPMSWSVKIERLHKVRDRMRDVIIDKKPAVDRILYYDGPNTVMYLDPPYLSDTRGGLAYGKEMTRQDHIMLAKTANECEARIAVSGYPSELYKELYKNWHVTELDTWTATMGGHMITENNMNRVEVLWTNYDPEEVKDEQEEMMTLDDFY